MLATAVALADKDGLTAVTMRSVAAELGVEAMSLYHHVRGKDEILGGLVEAVLGEVADGVAGLGLVSPTSDWRGDLRAVILTARRVLLRHPWAPQLIESSGMPSLHAISHTELVLRLLREGGFSWDLAHRALHTLGSRAFGFSQEIFMPDADAGETDDDFPELPAEMFPNLAGMIGDALHTADDPNLGWCDSQQEFEFAVDLILGGLEQLMQAERASA